MHVLYKVGYGTVRWGTVGWGEVGCGIAVEACSVPVGCGEFRYGMVW